MWKVFCAGLGAILSLSVSFGTAHARMLLTEQFFCEGTSEPWQLAIDNRSALLRHPKDDGGNSLEELFMGAHFRNGEPETGSLWRGTLEANSGQTLVAIIERAQCVAAGSGANDLPHPFRVLLSRGDGEPQEGCCTAHSIMPMDIEPVTLEADAGKEPWVRSVRAYIPAVLACSLETRTPASAVTSIRELGGGRLAINYLDRIGRPRLCTVRADGSRVIEDIQLVDTAPAASSEASLVLVASDGTMPLAARDGRPVLSSSGHAVGWLVDEGAPLFDDGGGRRGLGGSWRVELVVDGVPLAGPEMEITVSGGNRIEGRAGCFGFSGRVRTAGEHIAVGPLVTERLECEEPGDRVVERKLVMALLAMERFVVDEEKLHLSDTGGNREMALVRAKE